MKTSVPPSLLPVPEKGAVFAGAIGASSGSDEASAADVGDGCGVRRRTRCVTSSEGDAPSDTEAGAGAAPGAESRSNVMSTEGRAAKGNGVERKRLQKCNRFQSSPLAGWGPPRAKTVSGSGDLNRRAHRD